MTEGTACRLSPLPGFLESIPLGEYRRYSNQWDSELKTRRSQDWMQQFRTFLGHTESHDRGEDVGGDGKGRQRGCGAVFPFPSFLYCFDLVFPFSPWFLHVIVGCLFCCIHAVIISLSTLYIWLDCWLMWLPVIRATLTDF